MITESQRILLHRFANATAGSELGNAVQELLDHFRAPPSYDEMHGLLHRIYIARNIALREDLIHECLKKIDKMFADRGEGN